MDWKPIETAPEGDELLLCEFIGESGWLTYLGYYSVTIREEGWFDDEGNHCSPTHWMPLPKPPTGEQ